MSDSLRRFTPPLRAKLLDGGLRGDELGDLLRSMSFVERDAFVDELLEIEPPPPDGELPPGAVPYLPCGVDELLACVRELPITPSDQVVVLGSGLGRAALLLHLLTGARVHGIEIQAALVERARAIASRLRLPVTFEQANIADVVLDASVVFLYAPCNGALLARVIARIAELASRRSISIGAVGVELDVPGLKARVSSLPALALYP